MNATKCEICGCLMCFISDIGPYADYVCPDCGQQYKYEEDQSIVLTEAQRQVLNEWRVRERIKATIKTLHVEANDVLIKHDQAVNGWEVWIDGVKQTRCTDLVLTLGLDLPCMMQLTRVCLPPKKSSFAALCP